jgi:hypothetical protein
MGELRYRVVSAPDDGWEVVIEEKPGVVTTTYCSDWHRVERVCASLDRRLREAIAARDHQPAAPKRHSRGGSGARRTA